MLNIIVLITSRYLFKFVYKSITKVENKSTGKNVLIYGAGEMGTIVYSTLQKSNERRSVIKGFIDDASNKQGNKIDRINIFSFEEIDKDFLVQNKINEVIIAIRKINRDRLVEISDKFLTYSIKIKIVPRRTPPSPISLNFLKTAAIGKSSAPSTSKIIKTSDTT